MRHLTKKDTLGKTVMRGRYTTLLVDENSLTIAIKSKGRHRIKGLKRKYRGKMWSEFLVIQDLIQDHLPRNGLNIFHTYYNIAGRDSTRLTFDDTESHIGKEYLKVWTPSRAETWPGRYYRFKSDLKGLPSELTCLLRFGSFTIQSN